MQSVYPKSMDMPRIKRKEGQWARSCTGATRQIALLSILLFSLQATLPFLIRTCPLEQAGQPVAHASAMPAQAMADCPMMGIAGADRKADNGQGGSHKKHFSFCPLCNALSPFNGYVAAGLIDLPPPGKMTVHQFVFLKPAVVIAKSLTVSFSARAPPRIV